LSLGLASASPSELTDILVPAIAASILGGITLSGGRGVPLGVLSGVLVLSALRSGLNAIAAPPFAHDMATGAILFTVAIIDAPLLHDRLSLVRLLGSGN
jgi:ribose/xylose/arabinose/galactoside ABC-type transport system permease subunit